jgi:hypothetical protein
MERSMTGVPSRSPVSSGWRTRALAVLAVAAMALIASPAPSRAVTIGNSLANSHTGYIGCGVPCTAFQSTQPGATLTSPVDGIITSWSYRSLDVGASYALRVLHPVGAQYTGAGSSANVTVPDGNDTVKGPIATNLPIRAGDRLGLDVTSSSNGGAPIFVSTSSSDVLGWFTAPDLANGGSARSPFFGSGDQQLLVQATIQPCDEPTVSINSEQGKTLYVTGERASVSVSASDALGLASNPSQAGLGIDTSKAGFFSIQRTATNRCGHSTTATFNYQVLPKPVLGKSVTIGLVSGKVFLRLPPKAKGSAHTSAAKPRKFVPLVGIRDIPVGTTLDSRRGVVRIFAAANATSTKLGIADFNGGYFNSLQNRRLHGLTDINLTGGSFRRCSARGASAARSRRVVRRVRGSGRGRFRTRGRYSAATVRGTIWETIDRCDGTLTKVTQGSVTVRDLRKRRNVIVRAGKSYLARAP